MAQRHPTTERRRQIAAAALNILANEGASRLTAAELGRRVGIADGTVFRHFASMSEIVDAAIDLFGEALDETLRYDDDDALDRLQRFFVRRLVLVRERPEIHALALSDRLQEVAGEAGAQRVRAHVRRSVEFVSSHLRLLQRDGRVRTDVEIDVLVWAFVGVLRGAARQPETPIEPDAAWSQLFRLIASTPPST